MRGRKNIDGEIDEDNGYHELEKEIEIQEYESQIFQLGRKLVNLELRKVKVIRALEEAEKRLKELEWEVRK